MRRNSVVIDKEKDLYNFYKRVWRVIDDENVVTICCGLHVKVEKVCGLELVDYSGRYEGKHFLGMSRLRSLLKGARHYNPTLSPID
jgi:hypothetical protein